MRALVRGLVCSIFLALLPTAAWCQCSGQAPASTYCGNPTGATALPGWRPFSGLPSVPGGSTTQLQYNNAGSFGGVTGATTDGSVLTLTAPRLGTPFSGVLTNMTGLPVSTGLTGAGTGVITALGINVGTAGSVVVNGGALGTPSSGLLSNATGLPVSTGLAGAGTGVLTALGVNIGSAGAVVVNGGGLGTPSSGVATNLTGLPLTTGVTNTLGVGNGGTGGTTFTANLPIIGNGGSALAQGTRSGNTTSYATTSGAMTNGNCVSIDANGNLVAAGGACTTGGGGGTVNSGTVNQLAYYAGTGTAVSGLATANSALLVTNGSGVPSITSTIPAITLSGTVSGGGQQLNNIIIGTSTPLAGSFTSLAYSTTLTGTSANAAAVAVGRQGATDPAILVDASTASSATGIKVKSAAAAGGVAVSAISSGTNENLTLDAKGSGTITIGGTSTGAIALSRATTAPTLNGNTFTTGTYTLTGVAGKTLTFSNSLTLAGTDGTAMTFPSVSATIPRTVASGAKALATSAISSAACSSAQTDTATGTLTTDAIIATFNGDPTAVTGYVPLTSGMLTIIPYPTADTVNFKVCNNTSSSVTPGAITINWRVVR